MVFMGVSSSIGDSEMPGPGVSTLGAGRAASVAGHPCGGAVAGGSSSKTAAKMSMFHEPKNGEFTYCWLMLVDVG